MNWPLVLAHVFLPAAVAAAAAVGVWRCVRLLRYASDARLSKLAWFYGLFAASMVMMTVWTAEVAPVVSETLGDAHDGNFTGSLDDMHTAFAAAERVDVFLLAYHALMLASLGVAVAAFGHRRSPGGGAAAVLSFGVFAQFIPVALAVEAALTLYLAVQAILNHVDRRTPGALQVAAGFFLFFLGHLSYFVLHHPGAARTPLGDVVSLVGIALLVQLLPRPSA
jgi:hypothetical protein